MYKYTILLFFTLCLHIAEAQEDQLILNGIILSSEDQKPIPYATVINITDSRYGTTTDEDGKFKLKLNQTSVQDKIHISSLGYADTTLLVLDMLLQGFKLYLKPVPVRLPDFEVTSSPWQNGSLGNSEGDFLSRNDGISLPSPGLAFSAFVTPPRKNQIILDSLEIYLSEKNFQTPFTVRVLALKNGKKPRKAFLYEISEFDDLLNDQIYCQPSKSGWYKIKFNQTDITFPKEGVFLVFNQLHTNDSLYWTGSTMINYIANSSKKEQRYGHIIGVQKRQTTKILDAMYSGKRLGIIDKDNFHGALVVHYSYRK